MLIGFTGLPSCGKDSAARILKNYGFIRTAFADPLKEATEAMFGLLPSDQYEDSKNEPHEFWEISPRRMWQLLGDAAKEKFGQDFWIKRWFRLYDSIKDVGGVVVTDVRFDNEAYMIRNLGGVVVHIERTIDSKLGDEEKAHNSNAGVTFAKGDLKIANDGDLDAYAGKLLAMLKEFGCVH